MAEVMKTKAGGFPIIQAKLGSDTIATDLERVNAVLECMETDHMLLADFNGGLSLETALAELPKLTDPRIMWEEPCTTYQENMTVARRVPNQVIFDQCMQNQASYIQLIRDGVGRAAVLKPAYLGGLANSRGIRDMLVVPKQALKSLVTSVWKSAKASKKSKKTLQQKLQKPLKANTEKIKRY